MKRIATCNTPQEGDLLLSRLEHEGFRVCMLDAYSNSLGIPGVSTVKIMMHDDDLPRFRDLLEQDSGLRHLLRLEVPQCPRCNSLQVQPLHRQVPFLLWLFQFLTFTTRPPRRDADHLRCQRCGYSAAPGRFNPPAPDLQIPDT